MFRKYKLKKKISDCKKQITAIEKRRMRSQAAIIEAILTNTVADDRDVDYFNRFTDKINDKRNEMHEYEMQLELLKVKK